MLPLRGCITVLILCLVVDILCVSVLGALGNGCLEISLHLGELIHIQTHFSHSVAKHILHRQPQLLGTSQAKSFAFFLPIFNLGYKDHCHSFLATGAFYHHTLY